MEINSRMTKALIAFRFIFGVVIGFMVWALSPWFTGKLEPWDSEYPFYAFVLIGGGALVGLVAPRGFRFLYLGVWIGQMIALLVMPGMDHSWFLLGIFSTGIGGTIVLIGAGIGTFIRSRLSRLQ